jgi:hypothetical protein
MNDETVEKLILKYRAQRRAEHNAALRERLREPKTSEQMLLGFRLLEGLGVCEREAAAKSRVSV